MAGRIVIALAVFALAAFAPLPKEKPGAGIEGVWEQTHFQLFGSPGGKPRERTFVRIKGGVMTFYYEVRGGKYKRSTVYHIRQSPTAKLPTLDLRLLKEGTDDVRGIYKFEGGSLHYTYLGVDDDKVVVRPKGFALGTPGQYLMILKPAKEPPELPDR
jgi:hypothetical protein